MLRKTYLLLCRFNFNPKSYSGARQEGQSGLSQETQIGRELLEQCSASRLVGEMRLLYQKPANKGSKPTATLYHQSKNYSSWAARAVNSSVLASSKVTMFRSESLRSLMDGIGL